MEAKITKAQQEKRGKMILIFRNIIRNFSIKSITSLIFKSPKKIFFNIELILIIVE